jgi:hypothetical protein
MSKIIILDFGIYQHNAIYNIVNNPGIPATYTCLSMILGNLKRVGVSPDDKVIIACDARGSWRKEYEEDYKGDRAQKRKDSRIDWDKEYAAMEWLLQKLDKATAWNIIKIDHCLIGSTVIKTKGKDKYLSDLKKGEEVLTYNFRKHKFEYNKILNTFKNTNKEYYNLYFHGTEKTLKITGEHKIYTSRKWIKAKNLKISDIIYSYNDYEMEKTEIKNGFIVRRIEHIKENQPTQFYNIETQNRNYFANELLVHNCEADDIMAVASRYYKNQEVILCTYDSDLMQMLSYPNVKMFSPKSKRYKILPPKFEVYNFIAKKIKKEVADNLVNPILNEQDYDNRMTCVNLLELPKWVEQAVINELKNLPEKEEHPELIPFNSLRNRFGSIYNPGKDLVTYEKCVKYEERKKKRKVKKTKKKRSKK